MLVIGPLIANKFQSMPRARGGPEELTEFVLSPAEQFAVAGAPEEQTEFARAPEELTEVARAPEELTEFLRGPEEITEVALAPEELTELPCAPAEQTALACVPEELTDIMELTESLRPLELTELTKDVSYDVIMLYDPATAIQHIDFLMSAVTTSCAQERAAVAALEYFLNSQISKYEAAIQALNQQSKCVSRTISKLCFCDSHRH